MIEFLREFFNEVDTEFEFEFEFEFEPEAELFDIELGLLVKVNEEFSSVDLLEEEFVEFNVVDRDNPFLMYFGLGFIVSTLGFGFDNLDIFMGQRIDIFFSQTAIKFECRYDESSESSSDVLLLLWLLLEELLWLRVEEEDLLFSLYSLENLLVWLWLWL